MTGHTWSQAMLALSALAVDPGGLGGIKLRARVGPVLRQFQSQLNTLPLAFRRIHTDVSDTQLFGGPDVAATLATGRIVQDPGLVATPCTLLLPMAERTSPHLAARLCQVLDAGQGHALILFDEGAHPDEAAPEALADRLAFHISLEDIGRLEATTGGLDPRALQTAQEHMHKVSLDNGQIAALTAIAARFGIDSLRAPLLAARTARALAALDADTTPQEHHLRLAAELVYAARATVQPEPPVEDDPVEDTPPPTQDQGRSDPLDDMMIEAVAAHLPADLLARLQGGASLRGSSGTGAGAKRRGNRRGRPLAPRRGRPDGQSRIDILATLRAAAPWQPIRRRAAGVETGLMIRPDDIHLRRTEDHSDRLIIFCVDASGSAAVARLAEAKGAIELLLGQAYAHRDHVALISFRGTAAELLLPPTRSLVQAKRRLSSLPGGGGTPLAAGLKLATDLVMQARGQGLTPVLALMTDGRANVTLEGTGGRQTAQDEATRLALGLRALGVSAAVIDTAMRPGPTTQTLANALGARHMPLPRADAKTLSSALSDALRT